MRFLINTMGPKGYTGLQNKADSIEEARRVAKDSIKYAGKYFNDGNTYYAEIRNKNGLHVETIS